MKELEDLSQLEKLIQIQEHLIAVEEDRAMGRNGCTIDELDQYLDGVITEA